MEALDIYAKRETICVGHFKDGVLQGGYDHHKEHASKYIKEGVEYTVDRTDVGNWHTDVYLKEFPGIPFNSVHFIKLNTHDKNLPPLSPP